MQDITIIHITGPRDSFQIHSFFGNNKIEAGKFTINTQRCMFQIMKESISMHKTLFIPVFIFFTLRCKQPLFQKSW